MKTSNRQLTINGLLTCGWQIVNPPPTVRYATFELRPDGGRMFVGRSGALRYSSTGAVGVSRSWTDGPEHRAYREIGNPAIRWESTEQARAAYERILAGRPLPAVSGYVDFTKGTDE